MSICGLNQCSNFVFLETPKFQKYKRPLRFSFSTNDTSTRSLNYPHREAFLNLLLKAASSPSADFPGELLEKKPQRKSQRIAGIDQDELQEASSLADPDSCFCEFKGVQIHHKICDEESSTSSLSEEGRSSQSSTGIKRIGFPLILLHGFGASIFSWSRVMKHLSQITCSKVLAFDRPAFGLTSVDSTKLSSTRSEDGKPLNPYSIIFSVMATLYFIDFLAAGKAILVGHSAGSIVAVDTYFEAPERVAALILVAPAIFAPLSSTAVKDGKKSEQIEEENSDKDNRRNSLGKLWSFLSRTAKNITQAIINIVKGMGGMINSAYKNVLSALLRSAIGVMLIRMVINRFGIAGVRNAWYNSAEVTDETLQGYTKPLRVKNWDRALVEYTIAMLTDTESKSKPPLSQRLSKISCPVLIITGDSDRLVPPWNSEKLSRAIPGSFLEMIKGCGHLPQEEKPQEFITIVSKFLQGAFAASEDQHQLAVT
ncbi:serine protease [Lithospermum erythrorhizon]|uniref:Serine protease n=1 Tax=Lithospermum erythrorhizon TaxID=34254 RepID=A0AAV3QYZ4_LITER